VGKAVIFVFVTHQDSKAAHHGRILLTGASGFIGQALARRLRAEGREVVELAHKPREGALLWHPERREMPAEALHDIEAVIHLAGVNVGQRWSGDVKKSIKSSRVLSTSLLAEKIEALALADRPKVFICASAIGYYGIHRKETLDETSAAGRGFLAEVTAAWEAATAPIAAAGVRVVLARLGVVLAGDGGALERLLTVFKAGMAGPVGSGTQRVSWIGRTDVEAIFLYLLQQEVMRGPVNIVAPQPCTNREFIETMGRVLDKPAKMGAPAFALKLMFGEMAEETLLSDLAVQPRRLQEAGYVWRHADLEGALRHELGGEAPGRP
jgi:uncharacterized protein (TIGR01777 family)